MKSLIILLATTSFLNTINIKVYDALKSDSLEKTELILEDLATQKQDSNAKAYTGVLKMKKAGLIKGAAKKLEVFKKGKILLEKEIDTYPKNTEYRFLRLMIQENVPPLLKYKDKIEEDKTLIIKNYPTLSLALKQEIKKYTLSSSIIQLEDLKN